MGACCHSLKGDTSTGKSDPHEQSSMLHGFPGSDGNSTSMNGTQHIISDSDDTISATNIPKKNNIRNRKKNRTKNEKSKHYKILLLGPGMSGKTTLYKQMRKLHGKQYSIKDFINCKPHLTANLIESFRKLCIYSDILAEQHDAEDTKVSPENRGIRDLVARLNDRTLFDDKLCDMFTRLLHDDGIQKTLEYRYQFQLSDNFDYLIQNMSLYCKAEYVPTYKDYLHVKQRTVGIQTLSFKLVSKHDYGRTEYYDLHDAGGQRTERKKWMNVIRGATAYIFVAAISGYNQPLWEEPSYNRMREAIHLFRRIYHMDALSKTHVILFLNKYDLFEKKILNYSIKGFFKEYEGKETPALVSQFIVNKFKQQQNPKYGKYDTPNHSNNEDNSSNNVTPRGARETERCIYFHFTSATDTGCVNRVFELCRDIIVLNALTHIGFV